MRNLAERLRELGSRQSKTRAQLLKSEIAELLPDVDVSIHSNGNLVIVGRALRRRWLSSVALRFLGRSGA